MTFFVTSVGKGNGADLGGLEGADAHCLSLAKAAGSTLTNWRAYLSTTLPGGDAAVNARDRIGKLLGQFDLQKKNDQHPACPSIVALLTRFSPSIRYSETMPDGLGAYKRSDAFIALTLR